MKKQVALKSVVLQKIPCEKTKLVKLLKIGKLRTKMPSLLRQSREEIFICKSCIQIDKTKRKIEMANNLNTVCTTKGLKSDEIFKFYNKNLLNLASLFLCN